MTGRKSEIVRGSDNPFRDVGSPDPDTKLMKADLAAGLIRILRERDLTGTAAARWPRYPRPTSPAFATPT
jgi:hypothetical protein